MLRTALMLLTTILLLAGCDRKAEPAGGTAATTAATSATPGGTDAVQGPDGRLAETASRPLGHYSAGDTRVEFREAVWLPAVEPGTLSVLLAPTALSEEERVAVLESTGFPGGPLMSKRVPGYADRYPFVVIRLRLEGEGDAATVRSYYLLASSIHEPNYTDNLNGFPDAGHPLGLERVDGMRRLRFSGEDELGGMVRRWDFDVPAGPPPSAG